MKKLRVILADNHALVRAGIRVLIESLPDVEVVGEAGNGLEALKLIKKTSPDIAVLDIGMPELNGLGATDLITADFPHVKVIILSMHRTREFVMSALRAGASGYIVKDAATAELGAAIHAVALGASYLSPAISKTFFAGAPDGSHAPVQMEELTPRQRQVLRLVVEGRTMKEIAARLGISVKTAEA